MAWEEVCTPKWAGGLGNLDLRWLNKALQARWPWLQRVDKEWSWAEFSIAVPPESMALIRAATGRTVRYGTTTMFWEDRWVDGARICEIAPALYSRIPPRIRRPALVSDALYNGTWSSDVGPNVSLLELEELLRLWTSLEEFRLAEGVEDRVQWSWEGNGMFSVRSTYAAKFMGRQLSPTTAFTWKSSALLRYRFFSWLAIRNRCWTMDRLA